MVHSIIVLCFGALVLPSFLLFRDLLVEYSSSLGSSELIKEHPVYLNRSTTTFNEVMNYQVSPNGLNMKGQELVDYVNSNQNLWTAKLNPKFEAMSENMKRRMMGVKPVNDLEVDRQQYAKSSYPDIELPKNFDARDQWPNCQSVKSIRDQSMCGSCWAFGAVEAMSDRICIASGGKIQVSLSAADLISCCWFRCGWGCWGGYPILAWQYWVSDGIVTGSNYTAKQGCRPYPFPPCEQLHVNKTHYPDCPHDIYHTPNCERKCQNNYTKTYNDDRHYGLTAYKISNNTRDIQTELYINGPLEVGFKVYADFADYSSGIYFHTSGEFWGLHAVKLIGWGEDNGVPYWTLANSWNTDWGDNGFFRIVRGKDECGIESLTVVAGLPDLKRSNHIMYH